MWRPRYPTAADPETVSAPGETVGLSFFEVPHGGTTFVGHMGFQAGFRAFLYINPESGVAVIVALNTRNDADPAGSQAAWLAVRDAALESDQVTAESVGRTGDADWGLGTGDGRGGRGLGPGIGRGPSYRSGAGWGTLDPAAATAG